VLALPSQVPGTTERFGLSREALDRAAWTVDRGGRKLSGAAAINRTLVALGGGFRLIAALSRVPGIGWVEERLYWWVAGHRRFFRRLSVTPECDQPGVHCE
jgi:predicted DCC family thiol-disulfide oxidoreductase YuxK